MLMRRTRQEHHCLTFPSFSQILQWGGSTLGPDLLLAIVNAVNVSTFCTLSYFGNDDLSYDQKNNKWKMKEVNVTDVTNLAESF